MAFGNGTFVFCLIWFTGWPLLAPLKIQLHKCDKCTREFCSPVNFRRHKRMHRRSTKPEKVCLFFSELTPGCFCPFLFRSLSEDCVCMVSVFCQREGCTGCLLG